MLNRQTKAFAIRVLQLIMGYLSSWPLDCVSDWRADGCRLSAVVLSVPTSTLFVGLE